jgi:hypothetical protein
LINAALEVEMPTIVFIHGTGVREPHYTAAFGVIKKKLSALQVAAAPHGIELARCYWGDECGTKLNLHGASIPEYSTARDLGGIAEGEYDIALWALLYDDPLYELRLLALNSGKHTEAPPGTIPGDELLRTARGLVPDTTLQKKLEEAGFAGVFMRAKDEIVESDECIAAARNAPHAPAECRAAIARAILAECEIERGEEARLAATIDGSLRDQILQLVVERLGGIDRSVASEWLKDHVKAVVRKAGERALQSGVHAGAFLVRRYRRTVLDAVYAPAGDVLLYQASGDGVRGCIRKAVLAAAEHSPPVVLLGHSLGGIAAVDLLVGEALPVALLVTVGSQAPLLYELDALHSLRFGETLPAHFPGWLNFWDPRDLLSYVGRGVFKKAVGDFEVEDCAVDNGQPFVECHSGYWSNDLMWQKLAQVMEKHLK